MKKLLQRLKVWYYEKAMNTAYRQGEWYADNWMHEQAADAFNDGDKYRAKWLLAQGAHGHPAFGSRHNFWVDNLYDGDYGYVEDER